MKKYIIVSHHQEHLFIESVNQKIELGYMSIGGVLYKKYSGFYQAMILKE